LPATLCPNPSAVLAVIFIEEVLYRVGLGGCYTIINLLKMITMNTRYKDYDLDSSPAKSYGKYEWMTSIHINKLSSDGYKTKAFYCKEVFDTKEYADDHSIEKTTKELIIKQLGKDVKSVTMEPSLL
jgi:hypothetical protein